MSHSFSYKYPLYNGTLFNVFSNLCYRKSLSHTSIVENIKDYVCIILGKYIKFSKVLVLSS
jgi:hypothetical protein